MRCHVFTLSLLLLGLLPACAAGGDPHVDDGPALDHVGIPFTDFEGDIVDDAQIESDVGKSDRALPAQYDLLATQGPIRDQGRRNTCTAFAAAALAEHYEREAHPGRAVDLSEQYIYWQSHGGDGELVAVGPTTLGSAIDSLTTFGAPVESTWRYNPEPWGSDAGCYFSGSLSSADCVTQGDAPEAARDSWKYYLGARRDVRRDVNEIKAFLATYGDPVIAGFALDPIAWQYERYVGDVAVPRGRADLSPALAATRYGVHVVLIVGWDDNAEVNVSDTDGNSVLDARGQRVVERGALIVRNSWGESWGRANPYGSGYGLVSYNFARRNLVLAASAFSPRL